MRRCMCGDHWFLALLLRCEKFASVIVVYRSILSSIILLLIVSHWSLRHRREIVHCNLIVSTLSTTTRRATGATDIRVAVVVEYDSNIRRERHAARVTSATHLRSYWCKTGGSLRSLLSVGVWRDLPLFYNIFCTNKLAI